MTERSSKLKKKNNKSRISLLFKSIESTASEAAYNDYFIIDSIEEIENKLNLIKSLLKKDS